MPCVIKECRSDKKKTSRLNEKMEEGGANRRRLFYNLPRKHSPGKTLVLHVQPQELHEFIVPLAAKYGIIHALRHKILILKRNQNCGRSYMMRQLQKELGNPSAKKRNFWIQNKFQVMAEALFSSIRIMWMVRQ